MRFKLFLILLLSLLTFASCKTQYDLMLESNDIDAKYRTAFQLFENKKYAKAAEMFESLSVATRGTAQDDTVQFYWGYSNYKFGDFMTAESNLNQFIQTFPVSPFTEYAQYLRIECLYYNTYRYELDQVPTHKALAVINAFIRENPKSEHIDRCKEMVDELNNRLEMKAYKSAYLYYHMEDYLAAHYALKNVLKDNADNRYREEILYYTAMSAYKYANLSVEAKKKERFMTFLDDYLNVVSEYPETQYRKELDGLYAKAQKYLKKE